jgi:predicted ATP-binding protein involved in virulence
MFKLLGLDLYRHPQLGTLNIKFVDKGEEANGPYTTLIIGPNGTGKSFILRSIIDSFREVEQIKKTGKRLNVLPGRFAIDYLINGNRFEIGYTSLSTTPLSLPKLSIKKNQETIEHSEIEIPESMVANAILLNDRFPFEKSTPNSIYHYMGVRRTAGAAGTKTYIRRIVDNIIESSSSEQFLQNLRQVLSFLDLQEQLTITYYPQYRKYFFDEKLTIEKFSDFFENWSKHTKRQNAPWGKSHFEKIKSDLQLINQIVSLINRLSKNLTKINNSRSLFFLYDVLKETTVKEDSPIIHELMALDIARLNSIEVKKKQTNFSLEDSSSGEYHFFASMIGIMSKLKSNSLILIDEPEISLHPSWQLKYVGFIKNLFHNYPGCHFVIASHSHFLVSGLEGPTSALIGLERDKEIVPALIPYDTYAWSAEGVLYEVFKVRTTRNLYFEAELTELLEIISGSRDATGLTRAPELVQKLSTYILNERDPLNEVLAEAKQFLEDKTT